VIFSVYAILSILLLNIYSSSNCKQELLSSEHFRFHFSVLLATTECLLYLEFVRWEDKHCSFSLLIDDRLTRAGDPVLVFVFPVQLEFNLPVLAFIIKI